MNLRNCVAENCVCWRAVVDTVMNVRNCVAENCSLWASCCWYCHERLGFL